MKKAITITSIALAIATITGGIIMAQPKQTVKNETMPQSAKVVESKPVVTNEPTSVTEPTHEAVSSTPVQTVTEPTTPIVLSTNEYSAKYLNMTKNVNDMYTPQECLDALVKVWPSRFDESVREANIKALRFYERGGSLTICSTGIMESLHGRRSPYTAPIMSFGKAGEYFDSQVAAQYAAL